MEYINIPSFFREERGSIYHMVYTLEVITFQLGHPFSSKMEKTYVIQITCSL